MSELLPVESPGAGDHVPRSSVLIVSKWLDVGGAERFASTVLNHLDPARFELHLVLFRSIVGYDLPGYVRVDVLVRSMAHRPWHVIAMVVRLARIIRNNRPDVVVSTYAYPSFVTGLALRLVPHGPRWLARVSSNPDKEEAGWRRPLMRFAYRRADRFVSNSSALGERFTEIYPVARGRLFHLPNPTDFAAIDKSAAEFLDETKSDRPLLVAVGRLAAQKRVDLIVSAVSRVRQNIDVELIVCGDGPLRPELEATVESFRLGEVVRLVGFSNPFPWLVRATLFVLASDHEGSPNALIEAQGLGVPAIATDCPYGPSEIIENGVTGWLVPVGDADELAAAIEFALSANTDLGRVGEAARSRARALFDARLVCVELAGHLEVLASSS